MVKKLISAIALFSAILVPLSAFAAPGSNTYALGIEGFRDKYTEPSLNLTDTTRYGSVTGFYTRQSSNRFFISLDGRASYGSDDYKSPSGTLSGVPQEEFELRGRFGLTLPLWGGALSPYTGAGARYFRDEGKDYSSSFGAQAYDRRILQFYVPIGASLAYVTSDGWSITPQVEADFMFYGNVDSRLTNIVSPAIQYLDPLNNTQHFGIGGRGELMFGKSFGNYAWQVGPFMRYWHVSESNKVTYQNVSGGGAGPTFYEPTNNRTQIGLAAKLLW